MLTSEFIMAWFLVMFPLVYSPGPANTMFAANGAQFGFRRSLPFMAGIDVAFVAQSLLVGLVFGTALMTFPFLLTVLKYAGIAYIFYLGVRFMRAAMKPAKEHLDCLSFWDGTLLTFLNPKAWVMQLMMFSQFFDPAKDSVEGVMHLTWLLCVLNISGHIVWTLFGSAILAQATAGFSQKKQNALFSLMLFGSIYFLL